MFLAQSNSQPDLLTLVTGWVVLVIIAALALVIVWNMYSGTINLTRLISEPTGDASMSRFQLLVFTFVISASLFLITAHLHAFPAIPQGVLVLLGISSSSYLVSKGIQFSSPDGINGSDPSIEIAPQRVTSKAGAATTAFSAKLTKVGAITWSLYPTSGMGTIDPKTGLYTPPALPADPAAEPKGCVEVNATAVDDGSVSDVAIVHLG